MSTDSKEVNDDVPLSSSTNFHNKDWSDVIQTIEANYPVGLDEQQVESRLNKYGYNEVNLKVVPKWLIF
ncbi:hypothetical protein GCM10025879_02400 [Leuconostoc litchii]|nr:hypothetical protein GCM10025879_02400 [Leuconostoc litchii]